MVKRIASLSAVIALSLGALGSPAQADSARREVWGTCGGEAQCAELKAKCLAAHGEYVQGVGPSGGYYGVCYGPSS